MDLIKAQYTSESEDDDTAAVGLVQTSNLKNKNLEETHEERDVGTPTEHPMDEILSEIEPDLTNQKESEIQIINEVKGKDVPSISVEEIGNGVLCSGESFRNVQVKEEAISDDESEPDTLSISDSESIDSSEISDNDEGKVKTKKREPPKAKGELWLQDLPPIEDLHISVPAEQCEAIGFIKSIVDTLVIVEAYPLTPALDIESVLFLAKGDQALGHIFDVFGQVRQPHYCVRFNSKDHIDSRGVKVGELVYCAPKTPHTSYVLVAQLRNLKGTDSSWTDDHETPLDQLEFSDDEAERASKQLHHSEGGHDGRKKLQPRKHKRRRPPNPNAASMQYHSETFQSRQSHPYVPLFVAGFAPPRPLHGEVRWRHNGRRGGGRWFAQHQRPIFQPPPHLPVSLGGAYYQQHTYQPPYSYSVPNDPFHNPYRNYPSQPDPPPPPPPSTTAFP